MKLLIIMVIQRKCLLTTGCHQQNMLKNAADNRLSPAKNVADNQFHYFPINLFLILLSYPFSSFYWSKLLFEFVLIPGPDVR